MMGVTTKTVTICTCDICGADCDEGDNAIRMQVNGGDGRDVGAAYIYGSLFFEQPYRCSNGVVCQSCKLEWLKRYVDQQSPATPQQ